MRPARRASQALQEAEKRLQADKGPWPDPQDRDERTFRDAATRRYERDHESKRRALQEAKAQLPVIDRVAAALGIQTAAGRALADMIEGYSRDEADFEQGRIRSNLQARNEVYARQDQHAAWEQRRRRERFGNALVKEAIREGRHDVIDSVTDGRLDRVRETLLQDEQRRRDLEERHRRRDIKARLDAVPRKMAWREGAPHPESGSRLK